MLAIHVRISFLLVRHALEFPLLPINSDDDARIRKHRMDSFAGTNAARSASIVSDSHL